MKHKKGAFIMSFATGMWHTLAIYHWRDALEIIFFSTLFYHLAYWLKQDKTKNLLPYLYGSCLVTLVAYVLDLSTVLSCIFIFAPGMVALFILFHQETLQRNIVALKHIAARKDEPTDWQHTILKAALLRMNAQKELCGVISCSDDLLTLVSTPFLLNTPITHYTIELLFSSPSFDASKMVWFHADGSVRGINTTWNYRREEKHGARSVIEMWKEESQLFTRKTDAFAFRLDPETRLFTVIKEGIILEAVNAHQMQQLIRSHVGKMYAVAMNDTLSAPNKKSRVEEHNNLEPK
jgi:hypothetical protein